LELNKTYFYTVAIIDWKPLLKDDGLKDIIVDSLNYLSGKNFINVYAFVIMPNHIHLIWKMLNMNGKEMPNASFMKYTSHKFLEKLKKMDSSILLSYKIKHSTREHQFWQRNALSIELYSQKVFEQKLEYIHNNPIAEKSSLVNEPFQYKYSSAKFYETETDEFGFLKHCSLWQ
jgi:putative transposase